MMHVRRSHWRLLLWLVLVAISSVAAARELRPFAPGSMGEIVAAHSERPFILAFWSLTCTHCRDELTLFGNLQRQYPGIDIVLVSTDTPEDAAAIQATLSEFKLVQAEAWVFADSFADRLRFEVDKKWHGELPRTYFFAPGEPRKAYSGKLHSRDVVQWIKNVSRP